MASDEEFLLKWHDHHQSFFILVEELVQLEQLTDVTLACGDGTSNQVGDNADLKDHPDNYGV